MQYVIKNNDKMTHEVEALHMVIAAGESSRVLTDAEFKAVSAVELSWASLVPVAVESGEAVEAPKPKAQAKGRKHEKGDEE